MRRARHVRIGNFSRLSEKETALSDDRKLVISQKWGSSMSNEQRNEICNTISQKRASVKQRVRDAVSGHISLAVGIRASGNESVHVYQGRSYDQLLPE